MAYTQQDLDNIDRAIVDLVTFKQPVKFVVDGDVLEYPVHRLNDLRGLRNEVAWEVAANDPAEDTISALCISGGKGL